MDGEPLQTAAQDDDETATGLLDRAALLTRLKDWFADDAGHSSTWRAQAFGDFEFVTPFGQWEAADRAKLEAQMRPVITFDRCLAMIKAVSGTEINGRYEAQFKPRGLEDAPVNEVLNAASKWMSDGCDAEDEQSEAFQHTLICGMGWTEARIDTEQNPDGMYMEESISPLEMFWDRRARKKNLTDARRMWRVRSATLPEARAMFPNAQDDQLDASWARTAEAGEALKTDAEKRRREDNAADDDSDEITLVQAQWWEREPFWRVADPASGQLIMLSDEQYKVAKTRARQLGMPLQAVKQFRRVYRQAFIGSEILEEGPAPCKEHFSWVCITGEPYFTKGTWYGLIAIMRDPQMWANKWLSQTLHIMNSSAKGGILAEDDAFADQRQAEESYPKPEAITWMRRGALSSPNGQKFAPKPVAQFPAGFFQLMEFSLSSIRDTTGINLELMGLRDANQPGVLEAHRKQSAMTVLATMFDSLRRFRKINARLRLYIIQNFLSDGRLMRITGPQGQPQAIALAKDATAGDYDVQIDDAPTSPNQKEQNWAIISTYLPLFKDQLAANPELMGAILEYSPLPTAAVQKIQQVMMSSAQGASKQAAEDRQLIQAAQVAMINKDQSLAELNNAKAAASSATAQYDLAASMNLLLKHRGDLVKAALDLQKQQAEASQAQIDAVHTLAKTDSEHAKADYIRAQTHGQQVDTLRQALDPLPDHQDAFPPAKPNGTGTLQ